MSNGLCALFFSFCQCCIGTLLGPGLSCVAATTASPYMRAVARTRMPHVRGVAPARRDPPETRRPMCNASKEENGRAPRITAVPATILVGRTCG